MTRASPRHALPALLLVAACATAPDDPATTAPPQPKVVELPDAARPPDSFDAVVVDVVVRSRPKRLLRPTTAVMEFAPSDRFWLESTDSAAFKVTLRREEGGLLAIAPCDADFPVGTLENGESVTLSLIGRIPGFDDDARPRQGASDVVPRSR